MVGSDSFQTVTVLLFYSNPLAGGYEKNIGGMYHAMEMFNFMGQLDHLVDGSRDTAAIKVG